ncbi:hypothetical protein [Rothia mucilaginosa]|uniref:hypothetical protein n=1 Tax=Rothia mucilaginosa TaxID=43675 RepID=UPI003C73BC88
MANPFTPNQQPMPGNGQYPTGQQFVGGYGQSQSYGQQAQQGYYPQGQFQASPYGGQPEKKTGLIIGIIAAVLVVLIAAGVAIWWFVYNDDSSDDAAAQSTPSTAAPSAGANPSKPPVGTNPSQGAAPGGGSNSDLEQQAIAECTKEINDEYTNASVSGAKLELKDSYGDTQWWDYTGTLTGTDKITKKNVNTSFTCSVFYLGSTKSFTAFVIAEDY